MAYGSFFEQSPRYATISPGVQNLIFCWGSSFGMPVNTWSFFGCRGAGGTGDPENVQGILASKTSENLPRPDAGSDCVV